MKTMLTLSAVILSCSSFFAKGQTPVRATNQNAGYNAVVQQLLNQNNNAVQRSIGTKLRLVATSNYQLFGSAKVRSDSSMCFYNSNTRGSNFDFNSLGYSQFNSYNLYINPLFYNPLSYASGVFSDSVIAYRSQDTFSSKSVYDAADRLTNYSYYSSFYISNPQYSLAYNYNSNGQLSTITPTAGTWMNSGAKHFYYDAAGKVIADTTLDGYTQIPKTATSYQYDNNGNPILITTYYNFNNIWKLYKRYTNTYYPNNKVQTISYEEQDHYGNLAPITRDSFGYTNNSDFFTYNLHYGIDTSGNWLATNISEKHLNSQTNLPDSAWGMEYFPDSSKWITTASMTINYNLYNYPTRINYYNPFADNSYGNPKNTWINYYYEEYNNLSVKNTETAKADIIIFPNPSKDKINVRWNDFKQGNPVTVNIINAAGQLVQTEMMKWMQPTENFSTANLQSGVYWFSIVDATGHPIFNQSFVKE